MGLRKKLDEKIHSFVENSERGYRVPKVIIVHPETRFYLLDELYMDLALANENVVNGSVISYRGIKIFRSEDVEKDKFELF